MQLNISVTIIIRNSVLSKFVKETGFRNKCLYRNVYSSAFQFPCYVGIQRKIELLVSTFALKSVCIKTQQAVV